MKVLLSTESHFNFGIYCKCKDFAWITPLIAHFKGRYDDVSPCNSHHRNCIDNPQLLKMDLSAYPLYLIVVFKPETSLMDVYDCLQIIHMGHCIIDGDTEDRPGEDQYIFDLENRAEPIRYLSEDQLQEHLPEYLSTE